MALTTKTSVNFAQCDEYVQNILKSGLLLDEDMDCILAHFNVDDEAYTEKKLTFIQKLLSGISITSSVFIIQQKFSLLYLPIAASPLVIVGYQTVRQLMYKKTQKGNINTLIKALCDISKMNRMICEYYRLRNTISPKTAHIINPYTRAMKQLLELIFQEEVNLLYAFRGFAWQFGEYVHSLRIDYEYLENIDFEQFTINNIDSIGDCIIFLDRLCDIFVLVASSTLTCLAVTLCPNLSTMKDINIVEVLDSIVPRMKKMSVNCYNKINKKFDDVKYHHLNKTQIQKQTKLPAPNSTSKLYSSTCKVVACSSDILEKSQFMLRKLKGHNLQTLEEKIELSACIDELRNQVFDFYQSLDVLHKVFEININRVRPPFEFKAETSSTSSKDSVSIEYRVEDASFNPSEPSEDEEFELYIGANETSSEGTSHSVVDEQESRHFASLMSQELKQKLKTDARFVAARKKRGIIDEEPETVQVPEPAQPPPKVEDEAVLRRRCLFPFDANNMPRPPLPIGIPIPPLPNRESFNVRPVIPPPLPPPLPRVNLGPGGDVPESRYTVANNFLDSIKTAAKNRKSEEEVFQLSDIDDE